MHGIIVLNDVGAGLAPARDNASNDDVGAGLAPAHDNASNDTGAGASPAPTVGNIMGAYKSLVANECLDIYKMENKTMGKLWQRNFYEHIIRNEKSYQTISNYIINNPSNWKDDKFFSE